MRTLQNRLANGRKPLNPSRWQSWATMAATSCFFGGPSVSIGDTFRVFFGLLNFCTCEQKRICPVFMSTGPSLSCLTVTPATMKAGIPHVVASCSPARRGNLTPLGAKVLMARATIVARTASSCGGRAVWTYKGKRLTEAAGGGRGGVGGVGGGRRGGIPA